MTPQSNTYVGRFAPSPTGPLHLGSLVAALASYLDARANAGQWRLRIEDIDAQRCRPEFTESILQTLSAFGFRWDGELVVQSKRGPRYAAAIKQLADQDRLYGCDCSRREIADSGKLGLDGHVYPGTCRLRALPLSGHAARFRVNASPISFTDRAQGPQSQQLARDVGDFVVMRRDMTVAYQLAVVIDDFDAGVTDVVRGADLIDSTIRQIALQQALHFTTPRYLHIPVITNRAGEKLSKQTLAPAISVGAATDTLRYALALLRQPEPPIFDRPERLLEWSQQRWQPASVPPQRSVMATW
jgi:glutamyl-Q tRNA(Asp) synthetase